MGTDRARPCDARKKGIKSREVNCNHNIKKVHREPSEGCWRGDGRGNGVAGGGSIGEGTCKEHWVCRSF